MKLIHDVRFRVAVLIVLVALAGFAVMPAHFQLRLIVIFGMFMPAIIIALAAWWITFKFKVARDALFAGCIITIVAIGVGFFLDSEAALSAHRENYVNTREVAEAFEVESQSYWRRECYIGRYYPDAGVCFVEGDPSYTYEPFRFERTLLFRTFNIGHSLMAE